MNKIKFLLIKIIFILSLIILMTTILDKTFAFEGVPGVGWLDSLAGPNRWCCEHGHSLWSPDIWTTYETFYWYRKEYSEDIYLVYSFS